MPRVRPALRDLLRRLAALRAAFHEVGQRSMLRFTPLGKTVLGCYALSLFFVMNTGATMNYQLFALFLALLILGFCLAQRPRLRAAHFRLLRDLPSTAVVGSPLEYAMTLRNTSDQWQRSLQLLECPMPLLPSESEAGASEPQPAPLVPNAVRKAWHRLQKGQARQVLECAVPDLPPGAERSLRLRFTPERRGTLRFTESALALPEPLGIFRAVAPLPAEQSLTVLPRLHAMPPLQLGGGRRRQRGGLHLAGRIGEEGEFVTVREYRPGDPMRHIHWRSWARHGKPIVKEFQEEFFTRQGLVLDTFPPPQQRPTSREQDCFETAVSLAASVATAPRAAETLLDLLFVGGQAHCVTAGRGLGQCQDLLEILAGVRPMLERPFSALADLVQGHAPKMSGCICILLGLDEPRRALLAGLRGAGVETLCLVLPWRGREVAPETLPGRGLVLTPQDLSPERLQEALWRL